MVIACCNADIHREECERKERGEEEKKRVGLDSLPRVISLFPSFLVPDEGKKSREEETPMTL